MCKTLTEVTLDILVKAGINILRTLYLGYNY